MRWFAKRKQDVTACDGAVTRAEAELQRARREAMAARVELQRWRERRPHVEATGRAIRDQMDQNHLSQLLLESMRGR